MCLRYRAQVWLSRWWYHQVWLSSCEGDDVIRCDWAAVQVMMSPGVTEPRCRWCCDDVILQVSCPSSPLQFFFFSLHAFGYSWPLIEAVCAASSPRPSAGATARWFAGCPRLAPPPLPLWHHWGHSESEALCWRRVQASKLQKPQRLRQLVHNQLIV